ncbi:hypothetical protein C0J52_06199 [Blattella germanica]|nr:hypothetical protein C0J52_06199 [Blattella germanica]
MFFRRRLPNVISILLFTGGLLISIYFTRKLKFLYDSNQKFYRLENYKQYMEEISDYMHSVEVSANKSALNLHRLNSILQQQQQQQQIASSASTEKGT